MKTLENLSNIAYVPEYGARPLKRLIQKALLMTLVVIYAYYLTIWIKAKDII